MPANITEIFAEIAVSSVLDFINDLEKFEVITPDQAQDARANLAKDVTGAKDADELTDRIGHWMEQLTDYNAVKAIGQLRFTKGSIS
jgi:hypothetical protein